MPFSPKPQSPWPYFAAGLGGVLLAAFFLWQVFSAPTPQPAAIDERVAVGPLSPKPSRPASEPAAPPPSSLAFTGSSRDLPFARQEPLGAAAPPKAGAEENFRTAIAASESKARALAVAYTKKHPSIAQYGHDWMSYPDLKKLNDDYMRDHDPVKFMKGLSKSENFPKLVKKYAKDPAVHSFIIDAISNAPGELAAAVADYLPAEEVLKGLVGGVAEAMGLPKGVTAGLLGSGAGLDEKSLKQGKGNLDQAIQGDPRLGKAGALENSR